MVKSHQEPPGWKCQGWHGGRATAPRGAPSQFPKSSEPAALQRSIGETGLFFFILETESLIMFDQLKLFFKFDLTNLTKHAAILLGQSVGGSKFRWSNQNDGKVFALRCVATVKQLTATWTRSLRSLCGNEIESRIDSRSQNCKGLLFCWKIWVCLRIRVLYLPRNPLVDYGHKAEFPSLLDKPNHVLGKWW